MKLIIDIPTEFETDYKDDKFKDFFSRVFVDIKNGTLCGNYEKETAEMFLKAFDESVPMDNIVEKLEELKKDNTNGCEKVNQELCNSYLDCGLCLIYRIINIVKQEINNGLE